MSRVMIVQPRTTPPSDLETIRRMGIQVMPILDWQDDALRQMNQYFQDHGGMVFAWRWTQDPTGWDRWPYWYMDQSKWAVFANEPDVEGWPSWYINACQTWKLNGGMLIEPAWSDEKNYPVGKNGGAFISVDYSAVSWHDYNGNFKNRPRVLARRGQREVFGTEYGDGVSDKMIAGDLWLGHVDEPVCLFVWRWEGSDHAYDLANVDPKYYLQVEPPPQGDTKVALTINDVEAYTTELGPDGSGHARCGPACIASILLSAGWQSDPWGLTLEVTGKALGLPGPASPDQTVVGGMTSQQMIDVLKQYQFTAQTIITWQEVIDAIAAGKDVCLLLDNWYLRPRMYPAGAAWDALHWIRLRGFHSGHIAVCDDPLVFVPGEYPTPYQGPVAYDTSSIRAAIGATPVPESGIAVWR